MLVESFYFNEGMDTASVFLRKTVSTGLYCLARMDAVQGEVILPAESDDLVCNNYFTSCS